MQTLDALKKLIQDTFGIDSATLVADTPLSEYGLDSLSLAELLFTIEEHFDLDFPETRQDINTLAGLAALIDELLAAKKG